MELRRLVAEGRHKQYLTHFMTLDDQGFAGASGRSLVKDFSKISLGNDDDVM